MAHLVLADAQITGDLLDCLSGQKQQGSQDPALRVEAATQVVAAVSLRQIFFLYFLVRLYLDNQMFGMVLNDKV